MSFLQSAPRLGNQYDDDVALRSYLARILPEDVHPAIEVELREMGRISAELYPVQLADRANEPRLTQWDPWGRRVDHIELTPLWRTAARIAAERGVVATAYERSHGPYSRIHQFALAYLFTPSTDIYSCPLAMTDGAASVLLRSGNAKLIDRAIPRLTSRDPDTMWTSGQWMTETIGGSDVGRSETVARKAPDGTWRLYGRKWFTSAATAEMALTLARPEGGDPGGRGLALFYLETRDAAGDLNGISIDRLKDKLGTRKLPTAELTLDGVRASPVGDLRDGVRAIAPMLNVTRAWNAVSSSALMRRGLALARDYADRREAFGRPLAEHPLHLDTLDGLHAEFEGALHLTFRVAELMGRAENGDAGAAELALLRILTPIAKLTTARQAVSVTSECLEAFGGAGYLEDTGLPVLLRDAQVLTIWEGTTNVLALDALRAIQTEGMNAIQGEIQRCLGDGGPPELAGTTELALRTFDRALSSIGQLADQGSDALQADARRIVLTLGRSLEVALLAHHAARATDSLPCTAATSARRLARNGIDLLPNL
jgi:acyl-CoA dehydrogenase